MKYEINMTLKKNSKLTVTSSTSTNKQQKKCETLRPPRNMHIPVDIVNEYIGERELAKILIKALNDFNKVSFLMGLLFGEENTSKDSCFGGLYERNIRRHLKFMFPEYGFYHPSNDCELGDIYSNVLKSGIEIKTCQGIGQADQTVWYNGKITDDKYNNYWKYFLFIRTQYKNNKLSIKEAYYGYMPYKAWNKNKKKLSVCKGVINLYCKKII